MFTLRGEMGKQTILLPEKNTRRERKIKAEKICANEIIPELSLESVRVLRLHNGFAFGKVKIRI